VKAKGDFCEKITLEHDAHPQIIRALKGRTDFVEGPNPAVSNTRAFSNTGNHLPSLQDEEMLMDLPYIVSPRKHQRENSSSRRDGIL
jgi:hypothetical protein